MQPNRNRRQEIQPVIRPRLGVIQGGGESNSSRGQLSDASADTSETSEKLANEEQQLGLVQGGGESTDERGQLSAVPDTVDPSENVRGIKNDENKFNYEPSADKNQKPDTSRVEKAKLFAKKKGPATGIVGGLIALVFGVGITSFPTFLLVNVANVFTNYNGSAMRAANTRFEENLYYRLAGTTEAACSKAGAISTVRCVRGTVSEKNHQKMIDSGFDVKSKEVGGRYIITSVSKDGVSLNGKSSRANIKNAMKDPGFGSSMKRALPARANVLNGGRFSTIVLSKFGVDKSKVAITGSTDEERKESFNQLSGAADEDTDEKRVERFQSKHGDKINSVSKTVSGPAAIVGVGCSALNMSRATLTAVKIYNAARFASLAILFMKAADQIKANGDVDPATVALLGGVLTSYAASGPTKGLTATDSQGYKVAAYGGEKQLTSFSEKFLLGGNDKLIDIENTIDVIQEKAGKQTLKTACKSATDPIVGTLMAGVVCGVATAAGGGSGFIAGTVIPAVGNLVGGGAGLALAGGSCVLLTAAFSFGTGYAIGKIFEQLIPRAVAALSEAPIDVNKIKGVEAGNAIAAGVGAMMEYLNLSRGMQPGTKASVVGFNTDTSESESDYIATAKFEAKDTPFDIYNEYSFLGSLAVKSGLVKLNSGNIASSVSNVASTMFASALSAPTASADSSMAVNITSEDLSNCPDKNLTSIGVDCDVAGGTQYSMKTNIGVKKNMDFMIGKHVDEEGEPISEDYKNWVANCTDQRTDPIGMTSVGIEDENDWTTGKACVANSDSGIDQTTRDQFSTYYFDGGGLEDEEFVPPVSSTTATGVASEFTVATYNLCHEINHPAGQPSACPDISSKQDKEAKVIQGVSSLGNPAFDIIGSQETSQPTQKALLSTLPNYDSYPKEVPDSNGKAIFWNKEKFTSDKGGLLKGVNGNGDSNSVDNNSFPWVHLTSTEGQSIYVISAHSPNDGFGTPADRYENVVQILKWVKEKSADGSQVIVTGDLNNGAKKDGSFDGAYCYLTSDATLQHARDMAGSQPANKPCPGDNIPIDQIYSTLNVTGLTAKGWKHVNDGGSVSGTDHSPAYVTYNIPGAESAEGAGTVPSYKNPVFAENVPDPSVVVGDDGTYHVYTTGSSLQHLTSKDLVNWKRAGGPIIQGAPASSTGKMWAPDVTKTGTGANAYTMSWSGSSGGFDFDLYYATGSSAAGPFKYKGKLMSGGYIGTYDLDSNIFMSDQGPILYYGSGGRGLTAIKLSIASDGTITTTGSGSILFPVDSSSEWIAEGSWMQKHGDWYYMYYSVGRFDFTRDPKYRVKVARSKNPMGGFEKGPKDVLEGDESKTFRPGHNTIATDKAGNEWMIYHSYTGTDKVNRKLMIDKITYGADGWPIVNSGNPSITQQPGT